MGDQTGYARQGNRLIFPFKNGPFCKEGVPRREKLLPYEDQMIQLNPDLYSGSCEKKTEVDEEALDLFVNRIILSSATDLDGSFGIMDAEDGHKTHPEQVAGPREEPSWRDKAKKARKNDKKSRKGKKGTERLGPVEKGVEDYIVDTNPYDSSGDSDLMVIPLGEFRRLMVSEVKSKARMIHDYYELQWKQMQEDRMDAYRKLVVWKDHSCRLESEFNMVMSDLHRLQKAYDNVQEQFDKMKQAKRQKRNAAKQRRINSAGSLNDDELSNSYPKNASSVDKP